MSMSDSIARLAQSQQPSDYHWWKGEEFAALCRAVLSAGNPADVVVRMYPGMKPDGSSEVWFEVRPLTEEATAKMAGGPGGGPGGGIQPFNFSHTCPPDCDPGSS